MLMSAENIMTPNEGRYLKSVYRAQFEEGGKVRPTILARSFGVSPATVTETLQKLADKGLFKYTRYYGVELTEEGITEAQKLLRKHRLLEVLFVSQLNYDVEKAHEEASKLDYYSSRELINAICRTYGHPRVCPHNRPIFRDEGCCPPRTGKEVQGRTSC